MPMALVTAFISAGGLVLGSVVGGLCSWFITKASSNKAIKQQIMLQQENFQNEEKYKKKEQYINANIIRLDISTAIYQCIRTLKNNKSLVYLYAMPIYKDYHKVIASLSDIFSLKELSSLYQIYGLLDKINNEISNVNEKDMDSLESIRNKLWDLMKMVYDDNYLKIVQKEINDISYRQLYNDPLMNNEFRIVLQSLDNICNKIKEL